MKRDDSFLYELLKTPSVSGYEEPLQRKALAFGKKFADRQSVDSAGNVIQTIEPKAENEQALSVLLIAHADEIGFVVSYIDEKGLLHLNQAGGVRPVVYLGTPMQVWHNGQAVRGVVAISDSLCDQDKIKVEDLVIDIGADSAEAAKAVVSVGDPVCAESPVQMMLNDNISARALDDKSGVWVILEAARRAAEKGSKCRIYAVTSVGEETNSQGAFQAVTQLKPDCAIVVDVTNASDAPGTDHAHNGEISLGKGPVLCIGSLINKSMYRRLNALATAQHMPVQIEIAPENTYTDGDAIMQAAQGTPFALVSIASRYTHSGIEMVNLRDLDNCAELIASFLCETEADFDFLPFHASDGQIGP